MADRSLEGMALPLEVRARLAELELELSEGNSNSLLAPCSGRARTPLLWRALGAPRGRAVLSPRGGRARGLGMAGPWP